jgi:hypothetical protein
MRPSLEPLLPAGSPWEWERPQGWKGLPRVSGSQGRFLSSGRICCQLAASREQENMARLSPSHSSPSYPVLSHRRPLDLPQSLFPGPLLPSPLSPWMPFSVT